MSCTVNHCKHDNKTGVNVTHSGIRRGQRCEKEEVREKQRRERCTHSCVYHQLALAQIELEMHCDESEDKGLFCALLTHSSMFLLTAESFAISKHREVCLALKQKQSCSYVLGDMKNNCVSAGSTEGEGKSDMCKSTCMYTRCPPSCLPFNVFKSDLQQGNLLIKSSE